MPAATPIQELVMRLARLFLPALIAALAAAPAVAAPKKPLPARAQAAAALERVQALHAGRGVRTGRELTPALNRLAAALPALSGAERESAERLLARPTDGISDPQADGFKPSSVIDTKDTAFFRIHFVKAPGGDSDITAQADVDRIAEVLDEAYLAHREALGWRPPPSDGGLGGNDLVDVYLKNLLDRDIFGYVALDPGQTSASSVPHWSYMVLDNGYTETGAGRDDILKATAAHELNHVFQNGYDFLQDTWMFESTAVWAEEAVYAGVNDYLRYMADWVKLGHVGLARFRLAPDPDNPGDTVPDDVSIKAYGSAVWNLWLAGRFGADSIREAWERSPGTGDFAPAAYNAMVAARGGGSFSEEFERFAAQTAEWRAPGAGWPDAYPDIPRTAQAAPDGTSVDLTMDHTTFRHVDVPGATAPLIQASAAFPPGVPGAVALVGRTGGETDGAVTVQIGRAPDGGVARVRLDDPSRFARVTAVAINSDAAQLGFDNSVANDWVFRDEQPVKMSLDSARAPSGATADVSDLKDKSVTLGANLAANVLDTNWRFEYGTTDRYGQAVAAPAPLQNGNVAQRVGLRVDKLRPATVYHYRVVAQNALGTFTGEDRIFITADDVTKPVFTVSHPRSARRARGLRSRVRCDEQCTVRAVMTVDRRTARRLGIGRTLARGRTTAREGVTKTMTVRLGRKTLKRIGRAPAFRATVTWTATDESGNRAKLTRKISLRR